MGASPRPPWWPPSDRSWQGSGIINGWAGASRCRGQLTRPAGAFVGPFRRLRPSGRAAWSARADCGAQAAAWAHRACWSLGLRQLQGSLELLVVELIRQAGRWRFVTPFEAQKLDLISTGRLAEPLRERRATVAGCSMTGGSAAIGSEKAPA